MKDSTPQAVQACHDIALLDKFPRARRFTLGERLESVLLEVLEATVESAYTRNKQQALNKHCNAPTCVWKWPGIYGA
jgi:hypothetical protein